MLKYRIFNNINKSYFFENINIILEGFAKGFIINNLRD